MDPLLVKVSTHDALYLRKVGDSIYSTYEALSSGLEKMVSCFTLGQCESHTATGRERMSDIELKDLMHGSQYVLTFKGKDADWMLVGDVPWEYIYLSYHH